MTQSHPMSAKYWLWALLALAPALRLVSFVTDHSLWGVNHPAFVSWIWGVSVTALIVGGLFWVLRLDCSELFWSRVETLGGQAAFAVGALALFYFTAADTHLFGSGLAQVGNLAQRAEPFVDQYAVGATKLHWAMYQLTSGATGRALNDASLAVRILSALAGAISVFLWLQIVVSLAADAQRRSLFAGALMVSGATLLFFGNGAFFAPAALIVTLFIWLGLRLLQANSARMRVSYLVALVFTLALGYWYQAQLALLAPALIFVVGLGFFPGKTYERIWGALTLVALGAALFGAYTLSADDLWVGARLMYVFDKPPEFGYGLLSWDRVVDLCNSALALWPLAPALIWLILRYSLAERCDHRVGFLGALSLCSVAWILISDFPGGSAREIVSLAPFAIPPAALAGYLFAKRAAFLGAQSHKIINAAAIWSLLLVAPIHLFGESGVAYLDHDLQHRPGRSRSGVVNFRDHYFFTRDFPQADRWEQSLSARATETLDMKTVQEQMMRDKITAGMNRAEFLITSHPYWEEPYGALASALRAQGRNEEALPIIEKALQLNPPFETHLVIAGDIHRDSRRFDSAIDSYLQAIKYDPRSVLARSRLGLLYAGLDDFDSALKQAYIIFEDNPASPYSYLITALVAVREGDFARARDYLTIVEPFASQLPERGLIEQLRTVITERLSGS